MSDDLAKADYKNPDLDVAQRVKDLLARMSLEEKVAQLTSLWLNLDPESGDFAPTAGGLGRPARDLDIEAMLRIGLGQITRPFGSRPVDPREGTRALNDLQRRLVEGSRLGIPAIAHEESLTGFMAQGATQFPSPLSYGATWDPDLIERVGGVIRRQMRAVGTHQALAPVADVVRDARWGRVEECVSEDAYLVGSVVSAYVRGLQGDDIARGVVATLKHFAGYSSSEGGRNFAPVHAGPREMADLFLVPFEMAVVGAGALSVMNAYNDVDGQPCASSRVLLTETLRERWGFEGIVVADYGAVGMLETLHRSVEGRAEASAAALSAGLDVELPTAQCFPAGIPEALERGILDEATVDLAVERVLTLKIRLGLFERPYADADAVVLDLPEERALSREVAVRSITLLSNDGVLPLSRDTARIAVIGPNSDDAMALFGNYSFQNHVASHFPEHVSTAGVATVLDAIRGVVGADRVVHATGCFILEADERRARGEDAEVVAGPVLSKDRSGFEAAVAAARDAEVAVLVVGDRAGHFRRGTVGEGSDSEDLSLPGLQTELAEAVLATGTPTVVVLVNGRPFAIPELSERASAIVEAWFPGQEGAAVIADVLFGDENPGGKTPVSFSRGAGVQPAAYDHRRLGRGIPSQPAFEPVFAFGHGLSYTRFEYRDLALSSEKAAVEGEVEVAFTLANVGDRAGDEVVQLYARDEVASIARPERMLVGFARVHLGPGEARRVRFRLAADRLAFTGPALERIVEPGKVHLMLGASSRDIRLEADLILTGEVRVVGESRVLTTPVAIDPI